MHTGLNSCLKIVKVDSVQEACPKCFTVHLSKFEILQITWKKWNKEHQNLSFQFLWFSKFKISICEPQSIWGKLLVLSWLYKKLFMTCISLCTFNLTKLFAYLMHNGQWVQIPFELPFQFFTAFISQDFTHYSVLLKVRQFQNEFMKSSFLPKYEQKIVRISALHTTLSSLLSVLFY